MQVNRTNGHDADHHRARHAPRNARSAARYRPSRGARAGLIRVAKPWPQLPKLADSIQGQRAILGYEPTWDINRSTSCGAAPGWPPSTRATTPLATTSPGPASQDSSSSRTPEHCRASPATRRSSDPLPQCCGAWPRCGSPPRTRRSRVRPGREPTDTASRTCALTFARPRRCV